MFIKDSTGAEIGQNPQALKFKEGFSLENNDAGETEVSHSSFYVVTAGQHTTAGGDANESATATGVLATDIAIASIEDNGTNNVTLLQTAAAADAVNFTMSADPSTDAIINYVVYRAA